MDASLLGESSAIGDKVGAKLQDTFVVLDVRPCDRDVNDYQLVRIKCH